MRHGSEPRACDQNKTTTTRQRERERDEEADSTSGPCLWWCGDGRSGEISRSTLLLRRSSIGRFAPRGHRAIVWPALLQCCCCCCYCFRTPCRPVLTDNTVINPDTHLRQPSDRLENWQTTWWSRDVTKSRDFCVRRKVALFSAELTAVGSAPMFDVV